MDWALRKLVARYNRPPWEFDGVPEIEVYREAELIDIEQDLADLDS